MQEKFSMIAFDAITSKIDKEIGFDDGISLYPSSPYQIDTHWQRWLGSIRCEEIEKANLVLISRIPSTNPKILDDEHQFVQRKVFDLYYSIMLLGIPGYSNANMLTGSIEGDNVSIREVSSMDTMYVIDGGSPIRLTESDINSVFSIYKSLKVVFSDITINQDNYRRLRHGIGAYFKAIKERETYYRIPQIVRAIESIVLPKTGSTTTQFAHRCKTFVIPNPESEEALLEIYNLRSKVEHLHPPLELYPKLSKEQGNNIVDLRARMMEEIARTCLTRILIDPQLLYYFKDDKTISDFWSLPDKERDTLWGKKIDLKTIK